MLLFKVSTIVNRAYVYYCVIFEIGTTVFLRQMGEQIIEGKALGTLEET